MHLHFPWYFTALFWFSLGVFLTYQFLKITDSLPEEDDEDEDEEEEDRSEKHIRRSIKEMESQNPKTKTRISVAEWEEMKRQKPELAKYEKP